MKKLSFLAVIGVLLLMLAACGNSNDDANTGSDNSDSSSESSNEGNSSGDDSLLKKVKDSGTITVGFSNEAPYAYKDDDGNLTGAAVAVARAVFEDMGLEMKGSLQEWDQLIPGVKNGKLDVITAGMAIKPERCEQIAFATPSVVYGEGIAVKKGNPKDIHSYADIKSSGAKVAVLSGGTEVGFLEEVGVSKDQITKVPGVSEGFSAVKTGRADVTTATELTVKKAIKDSGEGMEYVDDFTQPDIKGVPSYGAAGFNKDADELRKAYNDTLKKLRESGKIKEAITSLPLWDENNLYKGSPKTKEICSGEKY